MPSIDIWGRLMKKWVVAASLGVVSLIALGAPGWSQNQPLSFGVIIWRSPTLTAQFWNPILRYVSDKSGVPLQLKVAQTGPEHTAMVRRGEYHFLYSNHNFIKENEESGYRVFARPKEDARHRRDRGPEGLADSIAGGPRGAGGRVPAHGRLPGLSPSDGRAAAQGDPGQGPLRRQPRRRDGPAEGRARRSPPA